MDDINRFCVSCFQYTLDSNGLCSHCGFNMQSETDFPHHLPMRSVLGGKYLCGRVLGEGGFGITYAGWDINLEVKVAIKEYYPQGAAIRNTTINDTVNSMAGNMAEVFQQGREKFIDEAKRLAKFHNLPGIVLVRDFFQENNTAYIVMEFVQGVTLKDYLDSNGGRLPYDVVLRLFKPLIESLGEVHKTGIIHRDISPDNIMVMQNGQLCLIDFGAARDFTENNRSLSVLLKPGYAPEEQYRSRGKQGPWTDVYALCATLYRAIEGEKPPEAMERMLEDTVTGFSVAIPGEIAQILLKGLSVRQEGRWQSVEELCTALYPQQEQEVYAADSTEVLSIKKVQQNTQPKEVPLKPVLPTPPSIQPQNQIVGTPKTTNRKKKAPYFVAVAVFLVVGILLGVIFGGKENTLLPMASGKDNSTSLNSSSSVTVEKQNLPETSPVVMVEAGYGNTRAVLENGSLWAWGWNELGQSELKSTVPVKILDGIKSVSSSYILKEDNSLWNIKWDNEGAGNADGQNLELEYIMDGVGMVSSGHGVTMAVKQDGSLWTWGGNGWGQVGNGTTGGVNDPVKIMEEVETVATSGATCFAVKRDGSLWAWGWNQFCQMGDGTKESSTLPVKIMDDVQSVSSNMFHSMAIKKDGSLWAWGGDEHGNQYGQLGNGSVELSAVPIKIMDDVQTVSTGEEYSMAIKKDGSLWAWGNNEHGQLGDETTQNRNTPVKIADNVKMVSVGKNHTISVKNDGSLWAWGNNELGQLGDGTTENRNIPVEIFLAGADTSEKAEGAESAILPDENNVTAPTPLVLGEVAPEGYGLSMDILHERKAIITITDWALEDEYLIDNEKKGRMEYEWAVCFDGAVDYELSLYTWSSGEEPRSISPQEMKCGFWVKDGEDKHSLPFDVPFVVHKSAIVFQLEVPDTVENFNLYDYESFDLTVAKLDEFYTNEFAVI